MFEFVSPPPTIAAASSRSHLLGGASSSSSAAADLMQMGFPALLTTTYPGVCACHGKLKTSGYGCPRCKARLCDVPTECRVCGLTVVNAPQLARSYRHLFPVRVVAVLLQLPKKPNIWPRRRISERNRLGGSSFMDGGTVSND